MIALAWSVHFLNASGRLDALVEPVSGAIHHARTRAEQIVGPYEIDIVVQEIPGAVIPELGHVGHAPRGDLIYLTVDTGNPNLEDNLGEPLERVVAHELHHVMRWKGPGYGATLGEVLVSEGLAGHFVRQLYRSEPEPWECAVPTDGLTDIAELAAANWASLRYDHAEWFFGRGELPRWAGYTLGYALVDAFLEKHRDTTAAVLADKGHAAFRASLSALTRKHSTLH